MRSATGKFEFGVLFFLCIAIFWLIPRAALADDLKLKDGTTISGTIVGFEENSFKVKTSYGYAVVQKDEVVSITVSDPNKTVAEKNSATPKETAVPAKSKSSQENTSIPAPPSAIAKPAPESTPSASAAMPAKKASASVTEKAATAPHAPPVPVAAPVAPPAPTVTASAVAPAPVTAAPAPAPASIPKAPAPEIIREEVSGNTYTNDTYHFTMYKPPDWEVIAGAPILMPGAVAAMGTNDETTYLLIGAESSGKSLAAAMEATENRLRDVMDNYRPLAAKQITVAASPATEVAFRGGVDDHEWSGVIALVPRGTRLYTIFGMTRADSDLVQIQENVIARTISSLQFTGP